MRLYLMQHGSAVPKETDPDRPLSAEGHADVRRLAAFLRTAGVRVDQVLHSGKTRSAQTAALLAEALPPAGQPEARAGLGPNDPLEILVPELVYWTAETMLVGHLPYLGRLASLLLAADADRPLLAFRPGTLACLERDAERRWALLWMLRPELLAERG